MTAQVAHDQEPARPTDLLLKLVEDGRTRNDMARFVVEGMVESGQPFVLDADGNPDTGRVALHGAIVASHLISLYETGNRAPWGPPVEAMNQWAADYVNSALEPSQAERLAAQGIRVANG